VPISVSKVQGENGPDMAALLLVLSLIVLHEFYLLGRANEVIE